MRLSSSSAQFVTSTAAAQALGVSTQTVRRFIARGWLRAVMEKGRYRLEQETLTTLRRWGPPLMPPGRAARVVGRDSSTIRRWLKSGRLPFVVEQGQRLVRREDLQALQLRSNAYKTRARATQPPLNLHLNSGAGNAPRRGRT
jgi:excisionase family DNA binding protein